MALDDGTVWRNLVTPAKAKVAETLDEFRGNHLYNRLDEHFRRFAAEVGQVAMWDDHEVRDNWYPTQVLGPKAPYAEKRVSVLAARARQAFVEHYPIAPGADGETRIHRLIPFGPLVEVFALDMRSYRGPNSDNLQATMSADTAFLGTAQAAWLADALTRSRATWKIVAADMPLGLVVGHQPGLHEAVANGDHGAPRGRELELAGLLRTLKQRRVRNVVWITADVHYCAAHQYDPARATSTDFDPFWEFVAGPAHAGTFAPVPLDGTFGPEVRFCGVPPDLPPNRPPSAGLQFFGTDRGRPAHARAHGGARELRRAARVHRRPAALGRVTGEEAYFAKLNRSNPTRPLLITSNGSSSARMCSAGCPPPPAGRRRTPPRPRRSAPRGRSISALVSVAACRAWSGVRPASTSATASRDTRAMLDGPCAVSEPADNPHAELLGAANRRGQDGPHHLPAARQRRVVVVTARLGQVVDNVGGGNEEGPLRRHQPQRLVASGTCRARCSARRP